MGRPKGTTLTPEDVVAAAVDVVQADGVAALGLHPVARSLGIRASSLYNHVDGLPDLERRVAIEAVRRLGAALEGAARRHPDAPLRAMLVAYRRFARSEPGLYAVMSRAHVPPDDPDFRPVMAAALAPLQRALAPAGLEGDAAIHAIRTLRAALHGFVLLEAAGGFGMKQDVDASFEWLIKAHLRAVGLES